MIITKEKYVTKKGKEYPILVMKLENSDKFPFRIGARKAYMILKCLNEIKEFVKENEDAEKGGSY